MSKYIDGYVLPVPKNKLEDYRELASKAAAIWMEHGALDYVEAVGDDMEAKDMTPFPKLAGAGPEEVVIFAYVVHASREARDATNAHVMADPRLQSMCPSAMEGFDFRRMAFGGFQSIVTV